MKSKAFKEKAFCENICQSWLDRQNHSKSRYWSSLYRQYLTPCLCYGKKEKEWTKKKKVNMNVFIANALSNSVRAPKKANLLLRNMRSQKIRSIEKRSSTRRGGVGKNESNLIICFFFKAYIFDCHHQQIIF